MDKTIQKIRHDVDTLISEAAEKSNALREKIETAKRMEAAAIEVMNEAFEKADVKAHHKAQDDLRSAQDAQKMYMKQLEKIEKEPLISKEVFDANIAAITDALDNAKRSAGRSVTALISQMKPIRDEYIDLIDYGNETMLKLQTEAYKDPVFLMAPEELQRHRMVQYTDNSMSPGAYVYRLLNGDFYSEYMTEDQSES